MSKSCLYGWMSSARLSRIIPTEIHGYHRYNVRISQYDRKGGVKLTVFIPGKDPLDGFVTSARAVYPHSKKNRFTRQQLHSIPNFSGKWT